MKKTMIAATLVAALLVTYFKSYAKTEPTRYRTTTCSVTHADGTTSGGTECYTQDANGPCYTQSNCNTLG